MQALAYPNLELEDEDANCTLLVKTQLLPELRSFCSALRVCEQVCNYINIFNDNEAMFEKINDMNEIKELAKDQEFCTKLEERVNNWIKGDKFSFQF